MTGRGVQAHGQVRRGMVLPMVLLILVLLGLMAASSSFYVYANHSAVQSLATGLQTRLAAEAGIQKVMLMLRTDRANIETWYDNPAEFHRVIVWSASGGVEALGTVDEYGDEQSVEPVYRFSIVADNPDDDEKLVRFGITDESSKLNINTATREQLFALISQFATEDMNVDELVDALIDWRDADPTPRLFGAENEYYAQLDPPYAVKNAPFDTVEELLLVRGFSEQLLYGEDVDRNGLLSPNEDDGDETFPPDDGDGELDRGLFPYVTVYSRDVNTAADNTQRAYLFGDPNVITEQLRPYVDDPAKLSFIANAGRGNPRITSPAGLLRARTEASFRPGTGKGQSQAGRGDGGGSPNAGGADQNAEGGRQNAGGGQTAGGGQYAGNDQSAGGRLQQGPQPTEVPSPITLDDMVWIMDRCTTSPDAELVGLINVNTAPPQVLATLPTLTAEDVAAIVEARAERDSEEKTSAGWIAPLLGADKFIAVAPYISARGTRFHVESLGYADHIGTITRLEAVIEMRGPIAQIIYNRDLTTLGTNFPIRYSEGDPDLAGYDR